MPALIRVWREGYGLAGFRQDALAGLTVAIVALPLSMGLAIASGVPPERGLYTAIVGGFLVSLLGGSRFQIGGPAGAFIVLVFGTMERHGFDGLLLAILVAGVLTIALGLFRLGGLIRKIPHAVTVGFLAGIAVIIFASQLRDLMGLDLVREPSALLPKLAALWDVIGTIKPVSIAISTGCIAGIVLIRAWRPAWPSFLIVIIASAVIVAALQLNTATVGSRFGAVPNSLPFPTLPALDWNKLIAVLPDAVALALLGAIESLLSAVVADRMSGDSHAPNGELVAQGIANLASAAFGGISVTGTLARTATNIKAGAKGPVSGMLHAFYLLLFMVAAAPLAAFIPLAALAAMLAVVAWNMAETRELVALFRHWRHAFVLLVTFSLTAFYGVLSAIAVGVVLSLLLRARPSDGHA
jgi:SulP family sulfate permease